MHGAGNIDSRLCRRVGYSKPQVRTHFFSLRSIASVLAIQHSTITSRVQEEEFRVGVLKRYQKEIHRFVAG